MVMLVEPDGKAAAPFRRVGQGPRPARELAPAGEHHAGFVQGAAPRAEGRPAGALLGGAVFGEPVAQGDPGRSQFGEVEVVPPLFGRTGAERPRELGQVQGVGAQTVLWDDNGAGDHLWRFI
ncbi:hypothetical protein ADK59_21755 [Streptomyces sp. XY332]|nr:hypothetical protein ADK59_21755 [Streptomyces sp. XY332]